MSPPASERTSTSAPELAVGRHHEFARRFADHRDREPGSRRTRGGSAPPRRYSGGSNSPCDRLTVEVHDLVIVRLGQAVKKLRLIAEKAVVDVPERRHLRGTSGRRRAREPWIAAKSIALIGNVFGRPRIDGEIEGAAIAQRHAAGVEIDADVGAGDVHGLGLQPERRPQQPPRRRVRPDLPARPTGVRAGLVPPNNATASSSCGRSDQSNR